MRILLADDHTLIRENLSEFLEKLEPGVTVIEAESFDQAQKLASGSGKIDLIILDLMMPGMDGLNGLKSMLKQYPEVPIVMFSGTAKNEVIADAMKMGARGFIPKTINGKAMRNAIRLILSGDTYTPPSDLTDAMQISNDAPIDNGPIKDLTAREREILILLTEGHPNKQIARLIGLKEITVKVHLQSVFRKFGVSNRTQAVAVALKHGINDAS
ncbi:MAG: response regulator transcription factor [Rhodospirillaceae bacterium]|nr:response regulator transcription factor [Rhodospirillaceae bacterium]